jgi:hypothetical protein
VPVDEDEDEEGEVPAAKKRVARKRRSESVATDSTNTADEWVRNLPRAKSGKAKSKCDLGLHLAIGNVLIFAIQATSDITIKWQRG